MIPHLHEVPRTYLQFIETESSMVIARGRGREEGMGVVV